MGFRCEQNYLTKAVAILIGSIFLVVPSSGLQCHRCIKTSIKHPDPSLQNYTSAFLTHFDTNMIQETDEICPTSLSEWNNSIYMETCKTTEKTFCGKRVIKIITVKYPANYGSSGSDIHTTSTQFPILRPQEPSSHEYIFTLFSCAQPEKDCNEKVYSNSKWNTTLEDSAGGNQTLQFKAELLGQTDCSQCQTNLCNMPTNIPNDESSTAESSGASSLISFIPYILAVVAVGTLRAF